MKLNLKELAFESKIHQAELDIPDRLPSHFTGPCSVKLYYQVSAQPDYYLLKLETHASLHLNCQRCLKDIDIPYQNMINLAICRNEQDAERLMSYYESLVSADGTVDLVELITDELHLYAPQFHIDPKDCDKVNILSISD